MLAIKSRLFAFGLHLLVSSILATLAAVMVFYIWYPGLLADASGVTDIFMLLIAVDVVIGPIITLIVFDRRKKELKRDLAVVGIFQFAALIYGMNAVFVARPVFIAYNADRFDLVYANDLTNERLAQAKHEEFRQMPIFGPKVIASPLPGDPDIAKEIVMGAILKGDDVQYMPKYYEHYSGNARNKTQPIHHLESMNPNKKSTFKMLVRKYEAGNREIGFLPLMTKTEPLTVIVDNKSGAILEITELRPLATPKKYKDLNSANLLLNAKLETLMTSI